MFGQQIKPGGFDLSWLVRDFQISLTAELDFEGEASNAERARWPNFDPKNAATLRRLVCHYCALDVVARILEFVWNNVEAPPPPSLGCESKLVVRPQTRNTLVNRYRHYDDVPTRAVLLSDDDIIMCGEELRSLLWPPRCTRGR